MTEMLQERRRLNDRIEQAFINTAECAISVMMYTQTFRGIGNVDLYERLYSNFALLVMLTADLKQMNDKTRQAAVTEASGWLHMTAPKDREQIERCKLGVLIFEKYKKTLADAGVIALPSK